MQRSAFLKIDALNMFSNRFCENIQNSYSVDYICIYRYRYIDIDIYLTPSQIFFKGFVQILKTPFSTKPSQWRFLKQLNLLGDISNFFFRFVKAICRKFLSLYFLLPDILLSVLQVFLILFDFAFFYSAKSKLFFYFYIF